MFIQVFIIVFIIKIKTATWSRASEQLKFYIQKQYLNYQLRDLPLTNNHNFVTNLLCVKNVRLKRRIKKTPRIFLYSLYKKNA